MITVNFIIVSIFLLYKFVDFVIRGFPCWPCDAGVGRS